MGDARLATSGALAALLLAGALGGCGDDSEKLREARREGAREQRLRDLERALRKQRNDSDGRSGPRSGGSGTPSPSRTPCGDGLSVGPNTSCPFGRKVRSLYPGSSERFKVYSPVTGKVYTMSCSTGSPHTCTGGHNASVSFP